jgi:hypothetical protein
VAIQEELAAVSTKEDTTQIQVQAKVLEVETKFNVCHIHVDNKLNQ